MRLISVCRRIQVLLFLYALCKKCVSQLFYIFLGRYYCSSSTHPSPLDVMYKNPTIAAPDIPQDTMKALLVTCTTETPFRNINGDIFLQKDGVSMGSPLGPLFANMYMCFVENTVLPTLTHPPMIYTRYVDDIFLVIKDIRTLTEIKEKFEALSVLKFTHEIEQNKTIALILGRKNNAKIRKVRNSRAYKGNGLG